MSVKTFFDDGQELVLKSLENLCNVSPELIFNKTTKSVHNAHHDGNKSVTLISGGGAGHEPAHAAFVGKGMLSAAVSGNIFASPSVSQIVDTIGAVAGTAGTILIVKNYTGDVFHFHLAAEKARVRWGHRVEVLVVGDDVAVGRERGGKVGRCGLAGTVLVHKILGALAAQGTKLDDLLKVGRQLVDGLATCGVSQGHVHIPGTAFQKEEEAQVELGMGIHNEPGFQVLSPRPTLDSLLDQMLDLILSVLLINNLGGTSQLELGAIAHEVVSKLKQRGFNLIRVLCGTLMTSLDASGFSITLLNPESDQIVPALDAATSAIGWPQTSFDFNNAYSGARVISSQGETDQTAESTPQGPSVNAGDFIAVIKSACKAVIDAEPTITESDRIVGDGDCGTTLARGANAVLEGLSKLPSTGKTNASAAVMQVTHSIEHSMDGTSGALYELFFTALAAALQAEPPADNVSKEGWAKAAESALQRLGRMTPAQVGDRTLMDALVPFVQTLGKGDLKAAVDSAKQGRDSTKGMSASLGRAVYVAAENFGKVADPGAEGVVAIAEGLLAAKIGQ